MPNLKPSDFDSLNAASLAIRKIEQTLNTIGRSAFADSKVQRSISAAKGIRQHIREVVSDRMEKHLHFYNVPSKRELESLGERIMEANERLVNIEKLLRDGPPPKSIEAKTSPPRTKTAGSGKRSTKATSKPKKPNKPPLSAKAKRTK